MKFRLVHDENDNRILNCNYSMLMLFVVYCLEKTILTDKESISFVISDVVILFTGCDLS